LRQRRLILRASTASRKQNWKAKFGGIDVTEAKRLKRRFIEENAKLKKRLAEHVLDPAVPCELLL
jgi:putative transposase